MLMVYVLSLCGVGRGQVNLCSLGCDYSIIYAVTYIHAQNMQNEKKENITI